MAGEPERAGGSADAALPAAPPLCLARNCRAQMALITMPRMIVTTLRARLAGAAVLVDRSLTNRTERLRSPPAP